MARTLPADATIGDRLRSLRTERGLTQEQLAEVAGVSTDLIKKLEQGRREGARLTTLTRLAEALDVPRSQLIDKRPRLDGGGTRLVLDLRDALISPDVLVGVDPRDDDGVPTDVDELWPLVRQGWADYWSGEFLRMAQTLPALIGEARLTHRAVGVTAAGPLTQAYQQAGCLLVHLGREDLAALAAERGLAVSATGDDELQDASLHGTYAWALLGQARNGDAERVAFAAAQRIEPKFSAATPQQFTVWGGLVLWAMAAAVEGARKDAAVDYIKLAQGGAAQLTDGDRHDYQINFGPTQMAMQTTYAYATLGEPARALDAARQVRRVDLRTISYGRHLLDVAQAQADARRIDLATDTLVNARDVAPIWFRHQAPARSLVRDLAERQTRLSPRLRDLVRSLEPR